MHSHDYSTWYSADAYNQGVKDGIRVETEALAATLTRLRATVKDLNSEDDRAYVRALEHVASDSGITATEITTVTVKYTA